MAHPFAGKRIYFAHQSVGDGIVEGFRKLYPEPAQDPVLFSHHFDPSCDALAKCTEFSRHLESVSHRPYNAALLKFSFSDFRPSSNASALFALYSRMLDTLRERFPATIMIPVTAPVTHSRGMIGRTVQRILQGFDQDSELNGRRSHFNRLMADRYAGLPIFDLARVQSTNPDGTRLQFEYQSFKASRMVKSLSADGYHLNEVGKAAAAAELAKTLTLALRSRQ